MAEIITANTKVVLEDIGEGIYGDYNPDDPEDVELLRFSVYRLHGDEWVELDDASYCTNTPASTPEDVQLKIVERIMLEVLDKTYVKKICEELSWIDPGWVEDTTITTGGLHG